MVQVNRRQITAALARYPHVAIHDEASLQANFPMKDAHTFRVLVGVGPIPQNAILNQSIGRQGIHCIVVAAHENAPGKHQWLAG